MELEHEGHANGRKGKACDEGWFLGSRESLGTPQALGEEGQREGPVQLGSG